MNEGFYVINVVGFILAALSLIVLMSIYLNVWPR